MSDRPFTDDRCQVHWIVREDGRRWAEAVRRFCDEDLADPLTPIVTSTDFEQTHRLAINESRKAETYVVLLWEIAPKSLSQSCKYLSLTAAKSISVIQIAAIRSVSLHDLFACAELGIQLHLRHPESLQPLARSINHYFNRLHANKGNRD